MFSSQTPPRDDEYDERDVVERDLSAGRGLFDQRIGMATEGSEYDDPLRWLRLGTSHRSPNLKNDQFASDEPSIGRRISRTLARFFFMVLIGVSITLAWQSYHEEAKEIVRTWVPSLGWLLPPTMKLAASAEASPELGQQLKPIALDLALVRHSVEQLAVDLKELAVKQEQIAQSLATLQAVERDLRQNISSVPPPGAVQVPRPKPTQPPAQSPAVQ